MFGYGLVKGEASSSTNPVIYFCSRWGEQLQDIISGTYQIDEIRDPAASAVSRVPQTAFVANDKLGTGRYVIPTGSTTAWSTGTHRVTVRYVMEAGGPTFLHVWTFEILDSGDWVTGLQYRGLVSTRDLYKNSVFALASYEPQSLHSHIDMFSRQIEDRLGRRFGPVYMSMNVCGRDTGTLILPEVLLAAELVQAVWLNNSGAEDTYDFDSSLYRVYNRHLDAHIPGEDDRYNPKITVAGWGDPEGVLGNFIWPYGDQNIKIVGVWGFTDPEQHSNQDKVPWGKTPPELSRVIGSMVYRYVQDPTMSDPAVWAAGAVKKYKTRDQAIEFGGSSATGSGAGGGTAPDSITGDPLLDRMLLRFAPPIASGYAYRTSWPT